MVLAQYVPTWVGECYRNIYQQFCIVDIGRGILGFGIFWGKIFLCWASATHIYYYREPKTISGYAPPYKVVASLLYIYDDGAGWHA